MDQPNVTYAYDMNFSKCDLRPHHMPQPRGAHIHRESEVPFVQISRSMKVGNSWTNSCISSGHRHVHLPL